MNGASMLWPAASNAEKDPATAASTESLASSTSRAEPPVPEVAITSDSPTGSTCSRVRVTPATSMPAATTANTDAVVSSRNATGELPSEMRYQPRIVREIFARAYPTGMPKGLEGRDRDVLALIAGGEVSQALWNDSPAYAALACYLAPQTLVVADQGLDTLLHAVVGDAQAG